MPLNADFLTDLELPGRVQTVTDNAAMLYALSIGAGADPLDPQDLRHVYEGGLRIFPTMPVVIGHPGDWMDDPRTGITRAMILQGIQTLTNSRVLPIGRPIVARNQVTGLSDKGRDKGAIVKVRRSLHDEQTGDLLATMDSLIFCRADGGFGGDSAPLNEPRPVPSRAPDLVVDAPIAANAALLYRLNHDRHPVHVDPQAAARAGFTQPILHGLGTYGHTARALLRQFPGRTLAHLECRFTRHVYPGEKLRVELWDEGGHVAVRTRNQDAIVLDHGYARLIEADADW